MNQEPWCKYKIGKKSKRDNWTEPDCVSFSTVHHITHVKDAIRIVEDCTIRSSLVWDESKLNNTRTCVSWVSPNDWTNGSIYGNISFSFLWKDLIKNKKFYWVEDYTGSKTPAYRILVSSKKDYSKKLLTPYPTRKRNGPIYYDGENWYRNGNFTGEILLDEDLDLKSCHQIKFVDHHSRICSKHGSRCKDIKLSKQKAGSKFMANIISRQLTDVRKLFFDQSKNNQLLTTHAQDAISNFILLFQHKSSKKSSKLSHKTKLFIAKACLFALSENDTNFLDYMVRRLGTDEDILNLSKVIIEEYFDLRFNDILDWE